MVSNNIFSVEPDSAAASLLSEELSLEKLVFSASQSHGGLLPDL